MWAYIALSAFIGGLIHGFIKNVNDYAGLYEERERKEAAQRKRERERREALERKRKADYIELTKQLNAVQYQLSLMEKLDNFRPDNLTDEKEVRKALSLEKQYNSLYQKERKLKRELEKLDY